MKAYKKGEMPDYVQPKQKPKGPKKKTPPAKPEDNQFQQDWLEQSPHDPAEQTSPHVAMTQQAARRKQRFVNLYSQEGKAKDVVLLPGRHPCECQAHRHALVNNCLKCGRIVCRQEGSGPCFTCGNLVCTNDEKSILAHESKRSQQLRNKLMNQPVDDNLLKAIEHKNKLLEYDRTSERRTRVIDDNSDYYSSDNKWLTPEQRELVRRKEAELKAEQEASRRRHKVTLDFAGRQVLASQEEEATMQSLIQRFMAPLVEGGVNDRACREVEATHFVDPALDMPAPEYVDTGGLRASRRNRPGGDGTLVNTTGDGIVLGSRIQDRGLMEMSDDGFALSMHQPYASLLVAGIKKHEGRSWYTTYRGRLWIHAAAKPPTSEDISTVVGIFQKITEGQPVRFPDQYPTGCLLGCVNLVDCLPQDVYREQYPFGECFSPYVYICEEPQELQVKFPMKGKHKIFKIDSRLHQASKKTLLCPQILT